MTSVFVDTNVLLYEIDPTAGTRQEQAKTWIDSLWLTRSGRLSYQVLVEFVWNAQRVAPRSPQEEVRASVLRYETWEPVAVDGAIIAAAWRQQDRYRISWWDALIVAAADGLPAAHISSRKTSRMASASASSPYSIRSLTAQQNSSFEPPLAALVVGGGCGSPRGAALAAGG